jgi:hypothetical protein
MGNYFRFESRGNIIKTKKHAAHMQTNCKFLPVLALTMVIFSCNVEVKNEKEATGALEGTWELLSETKIENGDTTFTPAASTQKMIKILNATHFSFVRHDLNHGKDSTTASFVAGAGTYTLKDSSYSENLEYCNAREWEGHAFNFTVKVENDTLVQKGVERLENLGIDRIIIEKYARVR